MAHVPEFLLREIREERKRLKEGNVVPTKILPDYARTILPALLSTEQLSPIPLH